jgi:hypothetical protein
VRILQSVFCLLVGPRSLHTDHAPSSQYPRALYHLEAKVRQDRGKIGGNLEEIVTRCENLSCVIFSLVRPAAHLASEEPVSRIMVGFWVP